MSIISAGTTTTTAFKVTGDTTGSLVFKTGAGAGTTALTIDASQNTTFANPVTFSGAVVAPAGTVSAPGITTTGDTNTGIFFPAADTIAFAEGGTEAMRLDSAGNVGIGTSSPGAKLDIRSGNLFFSSTSTTANTTLASIGVYQFNYPTTNQYASIDFLNGPSSWFSGSAIVFKTNGSADTTANAATEKMRLDGSGNVGIGTNNPLRRLDIAGGGMAFTESGGASRTIHWGDTTNIYPVTIAGNATTGNCFLTFNTNTFGNAAVERLRVGPAGQLGIGGANYGTAGQVLTSNGSGSAPSWQTAGGLPAMNIVSGTTQAATANNHYVLTNASATTVTLPASPAAGDVVWVTVANGRVDNVIARNGRNINSIAEDMTVNNAYAGIQLRYADVTRGWIFT